MRIVKEFAIEEIQVTVFRMEQRFTMKLEWNRMEQVFKLDARDGVESLDDVLIIIDQHFIQNVREAFEIMIKNKSQRLAAIQEMTGEDFPEII